MIEQNRLRAASIKLEYGKYECDQPDWPKTRHSSASRYMGRDETCRESAERIRNYSRHGAEPNDKFVKGCETRRPRHL